MRRFIKEWGIIIIVLVVLYFTGLLPQVMGFAQRMVLSTGIIAPKELKENEFIDADYDFELKALNTNKHVNLNEYKGKVIFINFWASWCSPCIAEMPGIINLSQKVDTTKIKIVLISLDRDSEKAMKFVNRRGITFPVYYPVSGIPEVFQSDAIPTTFVIDPNGKIVSKTIGMADYDKKSFLNFLNRQSKKMD